MLEIGSGCSTSASGGRITLFAERAADLRRIADAIAAYLDGLGDPAGPETA